jgi:hypothetical protein
METMLRFWPTATLVFFGIVACKSVNQSDLSGTWVVTAESRHSFLSAAQQNASARIVLDASGTFVVSEVPEDLLYGRSETGIGLVSGSGVWKLFSREGRQQVELEFLAITAGQRGAVPYGTQLNVSGRGSAVSLYYFQSDPDQARRIELERK